MTDVAEDQEFFVRLNTKEIKMIAVRLQGLMNSSAESRMLASELLKYLEKE